jgi:hypothetical protein
MTDRGGRIEPDGRPPVAPGVGKTARRHDLEAPKTPGLAGSDLQQGDVQRLEQAQRIAPIPGGGTPQPTQGGGTAPARKAIQQPEDAIDYLGKRLRDGSIPKAGAAGPARGDVNNWYPFLKAMATRPGTSGPLATSIMATMSNYMARSRGANIEIVDENAVQDALLA